jgi:hypothetical protein
MESLIIYLENDWATRVRPLVAQIRRHTDFSPLASPKVFVVDKGSPPQTRADAATAAHWMGFELISESTAELSGDFVDISNSAQCDRWIQSRRTSTEVDRATVDIGIVTRDRENIISHAVQGILDQTFTDWNLWIVDTGRRRIEFSDPRIHRLSAPRSNISEARNAALAQARGKYFAWLDDDEWWAPPHLERAVTYLEAHPTCALTYSDVLIVSGKFGESGFQRDAVIHGTFADELCKPNHFDVGRLEKGNFIPSGAVVARREAFLRSGGYDRLAVYDDWDMWLRMAWDGKNFNHLCFRDTDPEPTFQYRRWGGNVTNVMERRINDILNWQNAKRDRFAGKTCWICNLPCLDTGAWSCPTCRGWWHDRCATESQHFQDPSSFCRT